MTCTSLYTEHFIVIYELWLKEGSDTMIEMVKSLFRARRGNTQVAAVVMALVISITVIYVGVMMGGVIDQQIANTFTKLSINGSEWDTLRMTTTDYAQTAINIALIGILLAGIFAVLGVVFGFFGRPGGE